MGRSKTLVSIFSVTTLVSAVGAVGLLGGSAQASPPSPSLTVVASHLSNPRGLAMSEGRLYVAEAGRGGAKHCLTDPSGTNCVGLTGAIDRVNRHGVTRLTKGLVSIAGPDGVAAIGPAAVSVDDGRVYGVIGANTIGIPRAGFPKWLLRAAHQQLGHFGRAADGVFKPISPVGGPTGTSTSCPTSSPTPTRTGCGCTTTCGSSRTPEPTPCRWWATTASHTSSRSSRPPRAA